jgi:sulfotransferase family protein
MATPSDWVNKEEALARLLPSDRGEHDRATLLAELDAYARSVVREARRLGSSTPSAEESERALRWLDRPVFICGHHRSGTTLLQALLDGHPELLVLPSEGTYFTSFSYMGRPDPGTRDIDRFAGEWVSRFIDPNQQPHFKLGRSTPAANPYVLFVRRLAGWHAALRQTRRERNSFAPFLALLAAFGDITAAGGAPRLWVEKTPLNERYVKRLAAFRHARFIQLVRDPRPTLASLLESNRVAGISNVDSAGHARAIGHSLRLARENLRRFGGRYLVVKYEDLANEPTREMERVRDFLGISASALLSVPTMGGHAIRSNSSFRTGSVGVVQASHGAPPLSPTDARSVRAFTASSAGRFGYSIAQLGWPTRFAILLRHAALKPFRRLLARVRHL